MRCYLLQLNKKAYASFCGLALGDAAGMPFEMLNREDVKKHKENTNFNLTENFFVDIPDFHFLKRDLKKAEVTDDTILAVHLGEYLLENKGEINKEDYFSSNTAGNIGSSQITGSLIKMVILETNYGNN